MDDISPWFEINSSYSRDDLARFTLVLDAIEDAARRAVSDNVGELRLALIITDYVADVLLARHVERLLWLSERGGWGDSRQRFDSRTRGLLRQGFKRRLGLASRPYEARFIYGLGDAILDASEAEVLRVAHAYRNDAYHEDRHNEQTLAVIVLLALHATVAALANSESDRSASSWGYGSPLMQRLVKKGYEPPKWTGKGMFSLHAGAAAVKRWLEHELPVDFPAVRRTLAEDISRRIIWAQAMVKWLSGPDGPRAEQVEPGLGWHEFWRHQGADPELVRLDEARAALWETVAYGDHEMTDEFRADIEAAEEAYVRRFKELRAEFQPAIRLGDLAGLSRRGTGLTQATTPGSLLSRYRTLDMELRVFEETLVDMAVSWDEYVQSEVDRLRGK